MRTNENWAITVSHFRRGNNCSRSYETTYIREQETLIKACFAGNHNINRSYTRTNRFVFSLAIRNKTQFNMHILDVQVNLKKKGMYKVVALKMPAISCQVKACNRINCRDNIHLWSVTLLLPKLNIPQALINFLAALARVQLGLAGLRFKAFIPIGLFLLC